MDVNEQQQSAVNNEIRVLMAENKKLSDEIKSLQALLSTALSDIHLVALAYSENGKPCVRCANKDKACKVCNGFVYEKAKEISDKLPF